MKKCLFSVLILLMVVVVSPSSAEPEQQVSTDSSLMLQPGVEASIKVLDAWIEATMKDREQPGLSIGIVYDQDLIWSKGYGFADLERNVRTTPATLYRIASISKLFTTTAIMQLRDAGKLQLDDPVSRHLSWFGIRNTGTQGPAITIRHLLTHTSGLPREAVGVSWNELTFPDRQEMIRRLPEQETVYPAETEWKYSNLGLSLAGEILAAVSGEPWPQYIDSHILKPLGMIHTTPLPRPDTPGLAAGYGRRVPGEKRTVEPFVDIEAERPAGNLASSVEDLAKFVSLQFSDNPSGESGVLRGSTLREMHRVQWLRPDWQSGWCLGFSIRRVGEQTRVGHGGSLPGHRTMVEIAPDIKLGVIVLTNANDGDPGLYLNRAFEIVGPAITRATKPPETAAIPDPEWENYVGAYTWQHDDVKVMILDGKLTLIDPGSDNPWDSRIILEPLSKHSFRAIPSQMNYSLNGEVLTFELDSAGRVVRFGRPSFYWVRK